MESDQRTMPEIRLQPLRLATEIKSMDWLGLMRTPGFWVKTEGHWLKMLAFYAVEHPPINTGCYSVSNNTLLAHHLCFKNFKI